MTTITEDYCSYEVAKLLKEKGFDVPCLAHWYIGKETHFSISREPQNWNVIKTDLDWLSCPTHQMAMKWLREVYNLFIEPRAGETNDKTWYDFDIIPINGRKIAWNHYNNLPFVECDSYEQACESAIKYCLENLIYESK